MFVYYYWIHCVAPIIFVHCDSKQESREVLSYVRRQILIDNTNYVKGYAHKYISNKMIVKDFTVLPHLVKI